jgi:hypothetical protein
MSNESENLIAEDYDGRYSWRLQSNLERMTRLNELAGNTGGPNTITAYTQLKYTTVDNTPEDALLISLFNAWCEVCDCFIFGDFQAVILLCRSIAERSLKLEYIKSQGSIPTGQRWMLGRLVTECAGIVSQNVIDLVTDLKEPGNDRAHALLEITNPQRAIFGGNRGITVTSSSTYIIEPYRGDAEIAINKAHQILEELYR